MISTGNDIIALKLINPERTRQKRFYSKILCEDEIVLLNSNCSYSLSFEKLVWLAWSVKESVYKFHKRYNPGISFSPTKIIIRNIQLPAEQKPINLCKECEDVSFNKEEYYCCEVSFSAAVFYTTSFINDDLIFTVANNTPCFDNVYWGIKNIDNDTCAAQSESVRSFALNKLNQIFSSKDLSIEKNNAGCPVIVQQKNIPLSFTHHGKFVGYTFVINSSIHS